MLMVLSTILVCSLLAAYGVLIAWYRRLWLAIPEFEPTAGAARTRMSIVIPARNEEANIGRCIESLLSQSYPMELYEVIVVDDHSTDGTRGIVTALQASAHNLVYASLDTEGGAHKKRAIETGIGIASGDLIVTTDADCLAHPDWLQTLAAFYEEKRARFIAAPVRMGKPGLPHSALSTFQILDFITLQGITGAAVSAGFHSMCNGANLAYEKKAFETVGGFRDIDDIPSGDDMLLMHKIYLQYPDSVHFLKSRSAIVSTAPEKTFSAFVHQRVRWASKADRYDDRRISRVLVLVYALNAAMLVLLVAACFNRWWLWVFLGGILFKTLVEYPFVKNVAGFFGQRALMNWFAVLQPFHIVYIVVVGWMGKFAGYRWKGRTVTKRKGRAISNQKDRSVPTGGAVQ
ncbi:MAG TPA: glycosyltransferase [Puia sp.]|nr:glycosyltransferase [Puia sp.]